jgi:glyoxylase-like metal-dependent hydrolase (beta-lactamase superfamily II)
VTVATPSVPGVHLVDTALGDRLSTLVLFTGTDAVLQLDAGVDGTTSSAVLPALESAGRRPEEVRHVVVSHCDVDHFGGVADAAQVLPRAAVVAHEADAGAIEDYAVYEAERARGFRERYGWDEDPAVLEWCRSVTRSGAVHRRLTGDADIDLGDRVLHVIHVPGHTRGHLAVHDPRTGTVAVSDAVLGAAVPLADGSPAFPPTYRYVADYRATIDRIERLAPERIVTAHYGTFTGPDAEGFLQSSRRFVERLEELVLADLSRNGASSLAAVLARINPLAGEWPAEGTEGALAFPVVGHLEDLETRGLVTEEAGQWEAA